MSFKSVMGDISGGASSVTKVATKPAAGIQKQISKSSSKSLGRLGKGLGKASKGVLGGLGLTGWVPFILGGGILAYIYFNRSNKSN
jgi:hypothetical protein